MEKSILNKFNGILLINKGEGISSHNQLTPIKKILPKGTKIGHTGTLDPNATGLLVVAIGRATKFIQHFEKSSKIYSAKLTFGYSSDTQDIWGNLVKENEIKLTESEFKDCLNSFMGDIFQVPPMYSAIKKNGVPLYKLARKGINVDRKKRRIKIYSLDVKSFNYPEVNIDIECSKGTYIRTLIYDIAKKLGTSAVMSNLVRKKSDYFYLEDAIKLDEIKSINDIEKNIISLDVAFKNLKRIQVDKIHANHIKNGVKVDLLRFCNYEKSDLDYAVYFEEEFVGIARWIDGKILTFTKI